MASVITGSCFRLDVNGIVLETLLLMLNLVKFTHAVVVIDSFSSLWDSSMKSSNHVPFILLWMGTSLFPVLLTECYRHSLALIWGPAYKSIHFCVYSETAAQMSTWSGFRPHRQFHRVVLRAYSLLSSPERAPVPHPCPQWASPLFPLLTLMEAGRPCF